MKSNNNNLLERAKALQLYGIISHWDEVENTSWIADFINWEEQERLQRSLEHRLSSARKV